MEQHQVRLISDQLRNVYGVLGEQILKSDLQRQAVSFVVLLDILVFAYLYLEGRAFGASD